jgi:starvation-inducible outer membrane lipoprotein
MVIETTYENKEIRKKINDFIGPSFSLVESIKLNGIGSKRMLVKEFSPNMHQYAQSNQDRQFINVELRPNGIIVHIRKNYRHFAWSIPYYQLAIYKTESLNIHAQGRYIKTKDGFQHNTKFVEKMLNLRVKYMKDHELPL